jgi:hypothetical protein
MRVEPTVGKEEMNHYMNFEPYFVREHNEQTRRKVHSLRLGEQLRKNRKPHGWRPASTTTSVSRVDLDAKLVALSGVALVAYGVMSLVRNFTGFIEPLGVLILLVGTVISYLNLPKEEH